MKHWIRITGAIVVLAGYAVADGPVLFEDTFDGAALGPQWQVKEGSG